ncbi:Uncharacterised protein [Mycobacteroides abscessus subsp. abscessus]|nr:Uncharacterised protein [Mycobacteroides abscessus subsp. abscessus]
MRDPGHSTASRTPPRIISSTITRACNVDGFGPPASAGVELATPGMEFVDCVEEFMSSSLCPHLK